MRRGRSSAASVQTTPFVDRHADSGTSTLSTDGQVVIRKPNTARLLFSVRQPCLQSVDYVEANSLMQVQLQLQFVINYLAASNRPSSVRHLSANAGESEDEFESEVQEAEIIPVKVCS